MEVIRDFQYARFFLHGRDMVIQNIFSIFG